MHGDTMRELQALLDRLGDPAAREAVLRQLFERAYNRLRRLAAKILGESFPRFKGPHVHLNTTEVTHEAVVRLYEALHKIEPPISVLRFFRIAAQHVRWILLDEARKREQPPLAVAGSQAVAPCLTYQTPSAAMVRLYEEYNNLPEHLKEVVDLLYFHGLTQAEAAFILGVSVRTVRRHWVDAKNKLGEALRDIWPGPEGPLNNGHAED